ncbi:hypothetical protein DICVIV_02629 [Dictyocaulus viviparus]|uniref:Uncharacterized protein n=1 Tax=Dictyocaulus viviparus TaxID=29172 RepID=A0A0D8Y5A8_DICVI|nr:hypothetical protein DICVIV_02629 [Dictyocaulus viviparus]
MKLQKENDICELTENRTILCFCSKSYCSTDYAFLFNLWKKSKKYNPEEPSGRCLHLLAKNSLEVEGEEEGISCRKCENVITKLWIRDEQRCKIVFDCDKHSNIEYKKPRLDFTYRLNFTGYTHPQCFAIDHMTVVCVCDNDFCTENSKIMLDLWKNSDDYKLGSNLDRCVRTYIKDLAIKAGLPYEDEVEEDDRKPNSKENTSAVVIILLLTFRLL